MTLSGAGRFEIVRTLGAGGMGVVYEAFDRERRCRVALKTLRSMSPEGRLRFKAEFRSLQGIQHPNLVGLGELLEEDGRLFFTMELVRGVDFLVYVQVHEDGAPEERADRAPRAPDEDAPPPSLSRFGPPSLRARRSSGQSRPFDEARLRRAFGQLSLAIAALHAAGKVHRDIKPSNALVTAEGRVVLLDFGLVADADHDPGDSSIVGTEHFMAPEQVARRAVGAEADWYSMGVVLYVALTGSYPFEVAPRLVLDVKQREDPPPPGSITPGLPEDLVALCMDLLQRDPAARPSDAEVLGRLGLSPPEDGPALTRRPDLFVGRQRELAELITAFGEARAGRPSAVIIEGESGVGKSALLRRFLEQIRGEAQVLSGRCYERELLPYKAVDEILDTLMRTLSQLPRPELDALRPPDAPLLGRFFPALSALAGLSPAPPQEEPLAPREVRARATAALRELLRRVAARRPLVLAVDDLQWAGSDGMALLADLMRPPDAPPMLFLATRRTGAASLMRAEAGERRSDPGDERPAEQILPGEVRTLAVPPLPAEESRELVRVLLAGTLLPVAGNADALAAEAGGHPLFIDALVRHRLAKQGEAAPARLDEMLWARLERLEPAARRLLELTSIAGGPLPLDVAARAVAVDAIELDRMVSALSAARLVRRAAGRGAAIEPYHDRVRETILGRIEREAVRSWHGRLALALEASGRGNLEALAMHWRGAGEPERAAAYAAKAADQAAASLAFDRAARLYRMAIQLGAGGEAGSAERRTLLVKLADVLSSAGRAAEVEAEL